MKAAIKRLHSPDIDPEIFQPDDPNRFGFLLQLMVGPAGGPGEESFDIVVCTPMWLAEQVRDHGPLWGRHHLIVDRFDIRRLREFLSAALESEVASTWSELAEKIGRLAKWEFEDYEA